MQCRGRNKDGSQCKNNAIEGRRTCYIAAHGGSNVGWWRRFCNLLSNNKTGTVIGVMGILIPLVLYVNDRRHNARSGTLNASGNATELVFSLDGTFFKLINGNHVMLTDWG